MSDTEDLATTPLYDHHVDLGASMVPFAGYSMPVKYDNLQDEHRAVRAAAGLFDVSHMGRVEIRGADAVAATDRLLTNDLTALDDGRALYTAMCNEEGGIIDDLVVYRLGGERLLLCLNAANRSRDIDHIESNLEGEATLRDRSQQTIQLALQGPDAESILAGLVDEDPSSISFFGCRQQEVAGVETLVARTGYTGEDGFELYLPADGGVEVFEELLEYRSAGLEPCGLGSRDTLRLEAGLLLHGQDIDESTNPLEAGLGWLVKFDTGEEFIGQAALERVRDNGVDRRLRGLVLEGRGVLRADYPIEVDGTQVGELTSGTYAPTLEESIGLGYIDTDYDEVPEVEVLIRNRAVAARVVDPPFYERSDD